MWIFREQMAVSQERGKFASLNCGHESSREAAGGLGCASCTIGLLRRGTDPANSTQNAAQAATIYIERPGQRALHKSVATKPEGTTAVIWFEPSPALYPEALTNAALVLHLVRHVYLGPEELPRYPHYGCVKGVQLRWAAWKGVLLR